MCSVYGSYKVVPSQLSKEITNSSTNAKDIHELNELFGGKDCFTAVDRLKLIFYLLEAPSRQFGCAFKIRDLIIRKNILAFYPLHNINEVRSLTSKLMNFRVPWDETVEAIRKYYGEQIALYNAFLGHYAEYLLIPSIIGIAFQVVVWATGNYSSPVLPFFGIIIAVWSIFMLEGWKRKQAYISMMWGMSEFEATEQIRPEFEGVERLSHIDGLKGEFYPDGREVQIFKSFSVVITFVLLVIGVVASVYQLRVSLQPSIGAYASTIASIINTIQIQVFNILYQNLVRLLTNMENHRTETEYSDSLIIKVFLFQFVNSYASFFFLAFIAQYLDRPEGVSSNYLGQCGYTNCMQPLTVNLAIIFGSRLVIGNFLAFFIPLVSVRLHIYEETLVKKDGASRRIPFKDLSTPEKDYMLLPYDSMFDSITNYVDTAVQYGYMVLFATALPCACFFSMASAYVKLRINAFIQAEVRK